MKKPEAVRVGKVKPAPNADAHSGHRRRDIQGLRGVAVLVVVLFHSGLPVKGGFLGVDVFFVISGFVISGVISRISLQNIRGGLTQFYVNRLKRLLPALAVVLTFTVLVSALLQGTLGAQQNTGYTSLGAIFLSANLVLTKLTHGYFTAKAETNPLLHTWSLSVEEQFYLVFPILFVAAALVGLRQRRERTAQLVVAGVMTVVSLALALAFAGDIWSTLNRFVGGYFSPVTRAWEFGFGVLAFLLAASLAKIPPPIARVLRVLGLALILLSCVLVDDSMTTPGPTTLIPVVGAFLIVGIAPVPGGNSAEGGLATPVMVRIGDLSYSWYLWHWPFIVFAVILWPENPFVPGLAALCSLVPAWLSLVFVENPIRWRWNPPRPRLIRGIAAMIGVPAVLSAGLVFVSSQSYFSAPVSQMAAATSALHAGEVAGCANLAPPSGHFRSSCTWNEEATGKPIYLLGDSYADQLSEGLIAAAARAGRPLRLESTNGCPFVTVALGRPELGHEWERECASHTAATLEWLATQPPGLVIISNSAEYVLSSQIGMSATLNDAHSRDVGEKEEIFVGALGRDIQKLPAHGHSVVVIPPTPSFLPPDWPRNCTVSTIEASGCVGQTAVSSLRPAWQSLVSEISQTARAAGANVLDLTAEICPQDVCVSSRGSRYFYRDDQHISVELSHSLASVFEPALPASDAH